MISISGSLSQYAPVYKYFYMLMMLLWVARTTPLLGFKYSENPVLMPVYMLVIGVYYVSFCKKSWKPFLYLMTIMAVWYVATCVKCGGLVPIYLTLVYNIIIVHVAFNLYSMKEFLSYLEKVMAHLCFLAMIVWIGCNIFPVFFPNLMHSLSVYSYHAPLETNSVFVGMGDQFLFGIRRNIGFTWESGRFGCFVVFALYINLIRNNFYTFNRRFYLFFISAMSTLSTTCFVVLSILLLFYYINVRNSNKILFFCISIAVLLIIINAPFMMNKIIINMNVNEEIHSMMYTFETTNEGLITPQRITGVFLDYQNFIHDFWLGYNTNDRSWVVSNLFNGYDVWLSNGLVQIFSKYGVLVGLFFYTQLFLSSKYLSKELNYRGKYIFMILFMAISISYDFWENSVFLFFILLPFYEKYSSINRSYCNIQCR